MITKEAIRVCNMDLKKCKKHFLFYILLTHESGSDVAFLGSVLKNNFVCLFVRAPTNVTSSAGCSVQTHAKSLTRLQG